jgi:hypothetical protein
MNEHLWMNENTTNVKSTLYSKRVCWCIAEMAVPYSPLAITHILLHKCPSQAWMQGWESHWLRPGPHPPLSLLNFFCKEAPHFHPRLLEGGWKTGSWKSLTAQSPFGPNFRMGFFRTPSKAKIPKGRPCLCPHRPVHVRAILPTTLS